MYYERKLPHWQPENGQFFVTWRLYGSLPKFQQQADSGPHWLKLPEVAATVQAVLKQGATEWSLYQLHAWVIMSNHIHVLLHPEVPLAKGLMNIKSASTRRANRILGRTGPFWTAESYDHWVRSDQEEAHIIRYIEQNPVRAELVEAPELYPWSSAYVGRGHAPSI